MEENKENIMRRKNLLPIYARKQGIRRRSSERKRNFTHDGREILHERERIEV